MKLRLKGADNDEIKGCIIESAQYTQFESKQSVRKARQCKRCVRKHLSPLLGSIWILNPHISASLSYSLNQIEHAGSESTPCSAVLMVCYTCVSSAKTTTFQL